MTRLPSTTLFTPSGAVTHSLKFKYLLLVYPLDSLLVITYMLITLVKLYYDNIYCDKVLNAIFGIERYFT